MQLTEQQYKSLIKDVLRMWECTLGMGDMGAATDEAERVVNEWMELNKITLKED